MQVAAKKSWEQKIVRSTLVRGLLGPDQATSRVFVGRSAFIDKPGAPSITLRYAYVYQTGNSCTMERTATSSLTIMKAKAL